MATEIKLPELGENIAAGDVTKILVKTGQEVEPNQAILEIETDKAAIEVPTPTGGKIEAIFVKVGDKAKVGQTIATLAGNGIATKSSKPQASEPSKSDHHPVQSMLAQPKPSSVVSPLPSRSHLTIPSQGGANAYIPASPAIRRQARELGIDILQITGTGLAGRIQMRDLMQSASAAQTLPLPDFSKWGQLEKQPMSKVRRLTAQNLSRSWPLVPQVTQFDEADITQLEQQRKTYMKENSPSGVKITVTAILLKLVAKVFAKFPQFNASVDLKNNEIIFKKYLHIGVAVDTDRGLLVPVIRNVDKKSIVVLAQELSDLSKKAREKKIMPDEMQGGNFTISNLGGIGGTNFSPIVNAPEVAILGVSRSLTAPRYLDEKWVPRTIMPLALSYDHRLIDGADAARFLRAIVDELEQSESLNFSA